MRTIRAKAEAPVNRERSRNRAELLRQRGKWRTVQSQSKQIEKLSAWVLCFLLTSFSLISLCFCSSAVASCVISLRTLSQSLGILSLDVISSLVSFVAECVVSPESEVNTYFPSRRFNSLNSLSGSLAALQLSDPLPPSALGDAAADGFLQHMFDAPGVLFCEHISRKQRVKESAALHISAAVAAGVAAPESPAEAAAAAATPRGILPCRAGEAPLAFDDVFAAVPPAPPAVVAAAVAFVELLGFLLLNRDVERKTALAATVAVAAAPNALPFCRGLRVFAAWSLPSPSVLCASCNSGEKGEM